MRYDIFNVCQVDQLESICNKMNQLFGEQDHFKIELLEHVYLHFPRLINIAVDKYGEQIGHICFIPFNKSGYDKMLDPNLDEEDLSVEDLFQKDIDAEMYLFVYSIFAKTSFLCKSLVKETITAARTYADFISPESIIFAEVVSKQGGLLAKRMSLQKYLSYKFRDQELHLFKSSISSYVNSLNN